MTEQPAGPPCDMCQDEPAVMSVMNLADYSTLTVGAACLVAFHMSAIQQLTGLEPDTTPPAEAAADPAPAAPQDAPEAPAAAGGDDGTPAQQPAAEAPRAPRRRGK